MIKTITTYINNDIDFFLSLPVITLNIDILVKLVDGFENRYENRLINGSVAHEKATNRLSISPATESK